MMAFNTLIIIFGHETQHKMSIVFSAEGYSFFSRFLRREIQSLIRSNK